MTGKIYQELAMRTTIGNATERVQELINSGYDVGSIFNASTGIAGEAGEVNDVIKNGSFMLRN